MLVSRWIPDTVRRKEIGVECLQTFCLRIGSGLISKDTHRELEYLRHAGLFIRTVEDDEDKGDSKNDDDDDDSEDDDDSDSDLE
ncbi:hypothetical protein BT96DRAFT_387619 [Gymnopus androsaceus JB14]|uniref:Uncharacterized protein n=1 Tax=Gymnopus androsaceus JB14 TaxID=1447944 RepID=A0A6A4I8A3_9AGAR|nr:hypothetical protein BT96DRAFT_387619 [Gymnopus androsaceus JB14]